MTFYFNKQRLQYLIVSMYMVSLYTVDFKYALKERSVLYSSIDPLEINQFRGIQNITT